MKRLLLLGVLLSACKINDATFTPLGGGDAGPGDGRRDDTGPPIDAPPGGLRHAFYLDNQQGFYILDKAPNGDLSLAAGQFAAANGTVLVSNKNHVYVGATVAGAGGISDYVLQGTNLTTTSDFPLPNCQDVRHMALHPSGSPLLVTCSNPAAYLVSVDSNGGLGNRMQVFSAAINELTPAWSNDGQCLFMTDNGAPPAQSVQAYRFNAASNSFTPANSLNGPHAKDIEVHPTGNYVYITGLIDMQAYTFSSACNLAPLGALQTSGLQSILGIAIAPSGNRLFQLGERIVPYNIAADGRIAMIPGVTGPNGNHIDGVFDPAMPNVMYALAAVPPRVYQARIDPTTGNVTAGTSYSAPGQSPTDFVLVP